MRAANRSRNPTFGPLISIGPVLSSGRLACVVLLALLGASCFGKPPNQQWLDAWRKANLVWRGVHVGADSDTQVAQLKAQLPQLAALGVNVIVLEVDYSFEFRSHPEVRGRPFITRAAAHDLAEAAHAQGIRLIPQLNSLGHQSWGKFTGPLLAKHPEFDETPGQFPENKGIYCRSWCPQNPQVNRFVFGLLDDLADGFEADALHVGMDEVFIIGSEYCPRCRGHDPARLFAKEVNALHRHIVGRRKLEMLMWADRFLDSKTMGYSKWEASANGTQNAVNLVPKDIILCDWHYEKIARYPSVPFLLGKGFRVWPSGWQPLDASEAFSVFAKTFRSSSSSQAAERKNDPRMLGYLCTTWGKVKIPNLAGWPPIKDILPQWQRE